MQARFVDIVANHPGSNVWIEQNVLYLLTMKDVAMEMNERIGPTVKHVWNDAMHVVHTFLGVVINTTAYQLGWSSLHLLLRESSTT